jgi:hypothetical protein
MARARNGGRAGLRIEAETLDLRRGEDAPALTAYAFGQGGGLLGRAELKEGQGELHIAPTKEPEAIRVVVGPPIDSDDEQEVLTALSRLDTPEVHVRGDQQLSEALRFPIDRAVWGCWFRFCTVRGTLLKRTTTGGINVDLPVCGAEVEIYEVDPVSVIFPKIPDSIIDRIRHLVQQKFPPPPPPHERFPGGIPFPPPGPGPGPDPVPDFLTAGVFQREPSAAAAGAARSIGIAPVRQELQALMSETTNVERAAKASADEGKGEERTFAFSTGEATTVDEEEALASLRALADSPEVASAASAGLPAFRTELLARPDLVRSLLCWIYPRVVTTRLVATATTDECGHFRAVFWQGCSSDTPDLYFKAFRRIGFIKFPIYEPFPIACHTWWDYACGSEVTLITTSPFAVTCPPCQPIIAPRHWVLAMAVGNTSLAAIRGTSTALQGTTDASNIGLTGGGSPWGGDLRLRFEFDNTLRTDLNVRYYRVRYRKAGSGNPFQDVDKTVFRHYAHWVGPTLMIEPYKLGPQAVGGTPNLFEIPPALPPVGQWIIADAVWDTTSALFTSGTFAPAGPGDGLYEFELTLFNAAGASVNATTLGINYVVPTTLDLTTTIPTVDASTLGLVAGGRLIYELHVDNNVCTAALQPPAIGGTASADPCGLLHYKHGDSVTFEYTASHPNGFATYGHNVVRGATPLPAPISSSGAVGPAPGTHTETDTVAALLGGCTIAGFAETITVWATAIDGWSRLSGYDRSAIQAFVLAPH